MKQPTMHFYLLDVAGAFLGGFYLIGFLIIAIVVEWIVLILFKINKPGKLFLYSFIVNMVTLGVGYLLLPVIQKIGNGFSSSSQVVRWVIIFALTVLIEGFLLILLNKQKSKGREKIWIAAIVMNLASYLVLYWFIK